MPLYTFIMDYRGGTYLSQVRAVSPKSAIKRWAKQLDPKPIKWFGVKAKEELLSSLREAEEWNNKFPFPTAIKDVINIWCHTALIRGHLALIDIVETAE